MSGKNQLSIACVLVGIMKFFHNIFNQQRMKLAFFDWYNGEDGTDPVLRAGIAHLWFVTIHPFEDGNGRIARAITDMMLARSEQNTQRFYSMSAQVRQEREDYYDMLEYAQKGTLDITEPLEWFLDCLDHAFDSAEIILAMYSVKQHIGILGPTLRLMTASV